MITSSLSFLARDLNFKRLGSVGKSEREREGASLFQWVDERGGKKRLNDTHNHKRVPVIHPVIFQLENVELDALPGSDDALVVAKYPRRVVGAVEQRIEHA